MKYFLVFIVALISVLNIGCSNGTHDDLKNYIVDVKRKPAGTIDSLPTFVPYEAFIYSASSLRSPFDPPVDVQRRVIRRGGPNVKPDFNREKEYLESFDLNALSMVGTITKSGELWALLKDDAGGVHRVKEGNYIGKNHGKIVVASEAQLDMTEIVPDGLDGWIERPRVIVLSEQE